LAKAGLPRLATKPGEKCELDRGHHGFSPGEIERGVIDPGSPVLHAIGMKKAVLGLFLGFCLTRFVLPWQSPAQEPKEKQGEDPAYGSKFFDQLRIIFGRFHDSDLARVFDEAEPIQCSELLGRSGQWRPVAFFNEDRSLGDWCRENLQEVKSDLSVYTFKGDCGRKKPFVEVGTEFPVAESYESYRQDRIELDQIDVIENDPVSAALDARTNAYIFELPYLFLDAAGSRPLYTFVPPDKHAAYAKDVTSRWECKAVSSKDVTYRFLICRVATIPVRRLTSIHQKWEPSFGSSAYFILSDGMEAKSSVKFTFGDKE
jgi:hypothetical protein